MKNFSNLSIAFLSKEVAKAVSDEGNFLVNILNWAINWFVVVVVPAGAFSLIINSIAWSLFGAEYKSTAKKVYIGTLIAVGVGISAKTIMWIWQSAIKSSGI